MNSFDQNFATFDKQKGSAEEDDKYLHSTNPPEDKSKKGLADLTNIIKGSKPNIPLKNIKKPSVNESETRIILEISNLHCEITNKIKKSNSGFLQKIAPEDKNRANQNDPVSQLRDVMSIIAEMAAERGKEKGNVNDLTEDECQNYENLMQKLEEEVRNHIGIQQQLRIFGESIQAKVQAYEKNQQLKKVSPNNLEKIKKENLIKREELKRKQQEIDNLTYELSQKNDLIKTQADKLKQANSFAEKDRSPFQNSFIEQKLEKKNVPQAITRNSKVLNDTENNNPDVLFEKESRRKTSVSSVSGSNRSIQTHNSLKSNFEFIEKNQENNNNARKDMMDSSFLKKNLDGLSEKERGIIEYFQSKLNERDEQVMFLQNQIKSLMNTNRMKESKAMNDSPNCFEEDDGPQPHTTSDYRTLKPSKLSQPSINQSNTIPIDPRRLDLKKSSISNLEKAYLATDRNLPRESMGGEEKSFITTDRIYHGYHAKNASFHNDVGKDASKGRIKAEDNNSNNNIKKLLMEKNQKDLKSQNTVSSTQLKTSFLNKGQNKDLDDDLNSKYFLKAAKSKSPLKQDYKNYDCNGEKKRDLSAMNSKIFAETQRIMNEQTVTNGKSIDGKKSSYIEFLNKNRNYLFQD